MRYDALHATSRDEDDYSQAATEDDYESFYDCGDARSCDDLTRVDPTSSRTATEPAKVDTSSHGSTTDVAVDVVRNHTPRCAKGVLEAIILLYDNYDSVATVCE